MLEAFCTCFSAVARQLVDTRAEMVALVRFLRNVRVTAREIIETAAQKTAVLARGRHVLLIEDTSEVNYQAKASRKRGLGKVGNGTDMGLFVHPALAVDAEDGSILGLAAATVWRRLKRKAADYQSQPIENKESNRWIETIRTARRALGPEPRITVVADREADIYELFARLPDDRTDVVVRCNHDRALADDGGRLRAEVAAWPVAGSLRFDLQARPGRPARPVELAVRFGPVSLRQPKVGADERDPAQVDLNLVEVREIDPPSDQEAVVWRLYTTHPVTTVEDAARIVEIYRRRWSVEQVFRTLKSQGVDIEDSLLADGEALENLAAIALIAAVKVMQCVHARGETGASLPAARVFKPSDVPVLSALVRKLEGKTQKQKNPHPPGSLAWASWVVARLGGWKGYAKERPPGPITMHRGLQRYANIAEGFALALSL